MTNRGQGLNLIPSGDGLLLLGSNQSGDNLVPEGNGLVPAQYITERENDGECLAPQGGGPLFQEVLVNQLERPYQPSCFLPGKVERLPVQILVDTGCTTNLLTKRVFDRLPTALKQQLEPSNSHGVMADGTKMPFHGLIRLVLKIRHYSTEETFVVGQIDEDVILGMPFLARHECSIDFHKQVLQLGGKELQCTDRLGRPLACNVQVHRNIDIPPKQEVTVVGKVPESLTDLPGVIEGGSEPILLATTLNQPGQRGLVLLRCLNPTDRAIRLKAGSVLGRWSAVQEEDIKAIGGDDETPTENSQTSQETDLPEHVQGLYDKACKVILEPSYQVEIAKLLHGYQDVFSTGESDVGRTDQVEHEIPIKEGAHPIRQPPHRLGPEKEEEARKQVAK